MSARAAAAAAALILATLAAATATRSAETAALAQLMQLLAARQQRQATFTEVQQLAMLEGPLNSSGEQRSPVLRALIGDSNRMPSQDVRRHRRWQQQRGGGARASSCGLLTFLPGGLHKRSRPADRC